MGHCEVLFSKSDQKIVKLGRCTGTMRQLTTEETMNILNDQSREAFGVTLDVIGVLAWINPTSGRSDKSFTTRTIR